MMLASLSKVLKPATTLGLNGKMNSGGHPGLYVVACKRRYHMNVGSPTNVTRSRPRESDMPIVVKTPEKVKAGRAKGHYLYRVSNEY